MLLPVLTDLALGSKSRLGAAARDVADGGVVWLVPALRHVGRVVWIRRAISPELIVRYQVKVEYALAAEQTLRNDRRASVGDPVRQTARRHLIVARALTRRLAPRRVTVAHVFYEKRKLEICRYCCSFSYKMKTSSAAINCKLRAHNLAIK